MQALGNEANRRYITVIDGSRIRERGVPIPGRLVAHLRGGWGHAPQKISGNMSALRCILPHSGGSSENFYIII